MKTHFYEFTQNNSGGYFDVDDKVCHRVVIEAENERQAIEIFQPMTINQSPSCPCCGSRWSDWNTCVNIDKPEEYEVSVLEDNTDNEGFVEEKWKIMYGDFKITEEPHYEEWYAYKRFVGKILVTTLEEYYQYLANEYGWTKPDTRIYYLDGTVKEISKKEIPDATTEEIR